MISRPNVRELPEFQKANEFARHVVAVEGKEYEWVWDYAKDLVARKLDFFKMLDDKADTIIRYLGGGAGIFALGVLAKIDSTNWHIALMAIPALLASVVAVFFAIRCRVPSQGSGSTSIQTAKEVFADQSIDAMHAKAAFLGQFHLTATVLEIASRHKSRCIIVASWCYFAAIALLILPIITAVVFPPIAGVAAKSTK